MKKLILILIAFPLVFFACDSRADDDDDCEFRNELNDPDFPIIKSECSSINPFINREWVSVDLFTNDSNGEFNYVLSFSVTPYSDLLQYTNFGQIFTRIIQENRTIGQPYLFNDTSFKFFLPEHFLFGRIAEYTLHGDTVFDTNTWWYYETKTLTINEKKFVSRRQLRN